MGCTADTEPTPTPTPEIEFSTIVAEKWDNAAFNFETVPDEVFEEDFSPIALLTKKADKRSWILLTHESVTSELSKVFGADINADIQYPSWQFLYSIINCTDSRESLSDAFKSAMAVEVVNDVVKVYPKNYKDAFRTLLNDHSKELSARFVYSYIFTVYDENAAMREYIEREPDGNLKNGIVWPLESHTRLRKTWYADRDGGARRHTGTDIWAKEGTEIYSCTSGTVTYVGYGKGTGNAVIVEDEYGYEYHYYHMVKLTDFLQEGDKVAAGDLVGYVGNTGNSSLDHLHLTIAAPDGYYINPYPYLKAVEP